eukprot:g1049.t1
MSILHRYLLCIVLLTVVRSSARCVVNDSNIHARVQSYFGNASEAGCGEIGGWDVSEVTDFSYLFSDRAHFNADVSRWNVSSAIDMSYMFSFLVTSEYESAFNADVSRWDVSSVTDASYMFAVAPRFNADVSRWDVSSLNSLDHTFYGAKRFNADIAAWDVSEVTSMTGTFLDASTFNADLSRWNTGNVRFLDGTFYEAYRFDRNLSLWNTERVRTLESVFYEATNFSGDVASWNTARVESTVNAFRGASAFNADVSRWNTARVYDMSSMFQDASSFNGDVSRWNTASVTSMFGMFEGASSFEGAGVSSWNVANVANMESAFRGARVFRGDVSKWDVSKVATMRSAFQDAGSFNGNVSTWNTARVTNLAFAFASVSSIFNVFSGDVSRWNTVRVTTLESTFRSCQYFNADLSEWNVAKVSTMDSAFFETSLNGNLASWDTSKVTSLKHTFDSCYNFNGDVSRWNTARVTTLESTFDSASGFDGDVSSWNVSRVVTMERAFDGTLLLQSDCAKRRLHERWWNESDAFRDAYGGRGWGTLPACGLHEVLSETSRHCGYGNATCDCGDADTDIRRSMRLCTFDSCGTIPTKIGACSRLTRLELTGDRGHYLTGTLPTELGRMSDLVSLNVSEHAINGTIPSELGRLSSLASLDLSHNHLTGRLPAELLPSGLSVLILSDNYLRGGLPDDVALPRLVDLRLDRNAFEIFPPSLAGLPRLETLHLDRNDFSRFDVPREYFSSETTPALRSINLAHAGAIGGSVPVFADLENLSRVILSDCAFTRVPSDAFANTSRLSLVDLSNQNVSVPLDLESGAFRGLAPGTQVVLANNRVELVPSECFLGLRNARIDLANLRVRTIESRAFARVANLSIDLSSNYVTAIDPTAFEDGDFGSSSSACADAYGWTERCSAFETTAGSDRCDDATEACDDARLSVFDASTGLSARRACCYFGGGFLYGNRFVMDAASPLTCKLESGRLSCICSDPVARFDTGKSSCTTGCGENFGWEEEDEDSIGGGDLIADDAPGRCVPCPSASTAESGSWECTPCTFFYRGSKRCEVPVLGILIFAGVVVSLALFAYVVGWYVRHRMRATAREAQRARSVYKKEIEMLSSAWRLEWSAVKLETRLAAGGYGAVYRGWLNGHYEVAVKRMFDSADTSLDDEQEIKFLQRARHPRLVMFIGCGRDDAGDLFVVLEYMNRGDLTHYLRGAAPPPMLTRLSLLADVAEGMRYLHRDHGAVHRDLKCDNCLLCDDRSGGVRCKVADFGLSKLVVAAARGEAAERPTKTAAAVADPTMTAGLGTAPYMAPELLAHLKASSSRYDHKVDVYAFGIIMWETLSLSMPWAECKFSYEMFDAVKSGRRPAVTPAMRREAPDGYVRVMRGCWDAIPSNRPEFDEIFREIGRMRSKGVRAEALVALCE